MGVCAKRGVRPTGRPAATLAALAVLAAAGCSDDVVCPGVVPPDTVPYLRARLTEVGGARDGTTRIEVECASDPLPTFLVAFVNGRELPDVGPSSDLGLLATLTEDSVLWQAGSACSLAVTTDFGYATSSSAVPHAAAASAPAGIALGDSLVVTWTRAAGADYYEVTLGFAPASTDSLETRIRTRDTSAVFTPDEVGLPGVWAGRVVSVAGAYPEGGAQGNIFGDGRGFFTVEYSDESSLFEVEVADAAVSATALRTGPADRDARRRACPLP